ncbi:hypothetical protein R3P38DRAFT_3213905 [Favolaschia claudopus]|uniref:Uncharacterized protein n=1 Tax=Favolaschia claudopus TaxID=2862362 RepID=A0AAW0ADS1_9AGAR
MLKKVQPYLSQISVFFLQLQYLPVVLGFLSPLMLSAPPANAKRAGSAVLQYLSQNFVNVLRLKCFPLALNFLSPLMSSTFRTNAKRAASTMDNANHLII